MITLPNGDMWYADSENNRIVKINPDGKILRTVGRSGINDGEFGNIFPEGPVTSITRDSDGFLYTLTSCKVYKFDFNGGFIKSWGSCGDTPGTSEMNGAYAIHYSSVDNLLLVSDMYHHRIVKYGLDGTYLDKFGIACLLNDPDNNDSGCVSLVDGEFNRPAGLTTDSLGNIYVVDSDNHRVQVFSNTGGFILKFGGSDPGNYYLEYPKDVEILSNGDIIVTSQNTSQLKKFSSTGVFIAEIGHDGTNPEDFHQPEFLTKANDDSIWIADSMLKKFVHFSEDGSYLKTIGNSGITPGKFTTPYSVDFDNLGNMLILDSTGRVQKFGANGLYKTTVIASGVIPPYSYHIAISPITQNIFVSSATVVNVFLPNGELLGTLGNHGINGPSIGTGDFNHARGMAFDSSGNVYVADMYNNRIQKFDPTQIDNSVGGYLSTINLLMAGTTWKSYWEYGGNTYSMYDEVLYNGNYYISKQDINTNHQLTDTNWWYDTISLPNKGSWLSEEEYSPNDRVIHNEQWYLSLQEPNVNNVPSTSPLNWELISNMGDWVTETTYNKYDEVLYNGNYYVSKQSSNTNIPTDTDWWFNPISPSDNIDWVSGEYFIGDVVTYNEQWYHSIQEPNVNNVPSTSPTYWALNGDTFDWEDETLYNKYDAVFYYDNYYISIQDNNTLNLPTDTNWWYDTNYMPHKGDWGSESEYLLNDRVTFNGQEYISLQDLNINNDPSIPSSEYWALIPDTGARVAETHYNQYDGVWYGGHYYISILGDNTYLPTNTVGWYDTNYMPDKGDWISGSYSPDDMVSYNGQEYLSLQESNLGNDPSLSPENWALIKENGTWVGGTTYTTNDAVLYEGTTYISLQDSNASHLPTDSAWWTPWTPSGDGEVAKPVNLFIDETDNLYVSSGEASEGVLRIQKFNNLGVWDSLFMDKFGLPEIQGGYWKISGIFIDSSEKIYLSDSYFNHINIYDTNGSLLEQVGSRGSGDDQYDQPASVKINPLNGDIVVVDQMNHRLEILLNGVKINNLTPSADVINATGGLSLVKETIDPNSPNSGNLSAEMYFGDYIVSDFNLNLTQDRNWGTVNAIVLPDKSKSLVVNLNPSDAPGISETHSLYIAKHQGQNFVTICPTATTIAELIPGCTDSYTLNEGDPSLSVVTIDGIEYWKVEGLTGTGGFSPVVQTFNLSEPETPIAGVPFNLVITAKTDEGVLDTGYTGTITFSTNPSTSTLPNDYVFTDEDNGSHTFTGLILNEARIYELTVTDTDDPTRTQTISITVNPATTPTPTTAPSSGSDNNSSSSNNGSSSSSGPTVCTNQKPGALAPYIWKTESLGGGQVKLYFKDAASPVTDYHLVFGTKTGKYTYGGLNVAKFQDSSLIVSYLKPNTRYYFKLIPNNGCASGTWSNEVSILSGRRYSALTTNIKNTISKAINTVTEKKLISPIPATEEIAPPTKLLSPEPTTKVILPQPQAPPPPKENLFTKILKFFGLK